MKKDLLIKIISLVLVIIIIANLILLTIGKIKPLLFWIIVIVIAIIAYKFIPLVKT